VKPVGEGFFLGAAFVLAFLAWLSFYRAAKGPSAADRIVAINVIGTKTLAILVLVGFAHQEMSIFLDVALVYALISFLATVGLAQYFSRGSLF